VRRHGWPRPATRRPRARHRPLTGGHSLGPPHLGTWIVKSRRHVVAAGDLDATETVGPRLPSAPPAPAPSSANGTAVSPGASEATEPTALSPAPSSSSSGTCSPTPLPGSPTSDPAGTTAAPTATARSAPTSASSRPSASTSNSPKPPLKPKPALTRPVPQALRAVKPCRRLVADSHGHRSATRSVESIFGTHPCARSLCRPGGPDGEGPGPGRARRTSAGRPGSDPALCRQRPR
jgi:hypothetical protein